MNFNYVSYINVSVCFNLFKRYYSSNTRFTKDNINFIKINPVDLSLDSFGRVLLENLKVGVTYSLLFKVRFNDSLFGMLGTQKGFKLSSNYDYQSIEETFTFFCDAKSNFEDEYEVDYVNVIELMYVIIQDLPILKLKNFNKVKLNKDFVNIKDTKVDFSSVYLPLTCNTNYYGKLLLAEDRDKYIENINKEKKLLFQDDISILDYDSMYLYRDSFIILNKKINDGKFLREVYYSSGVLKNFYEDVIVNQDSFTRKRGKLVITISNNKVVHIKVDKDLFTIKYYPKAYKVSHKPFIGSFDVETFKSLYESENIARVYALGFNALGEEPKTFYIDKYKDSVELVVGCFDNMLSDKYNGYIFYTHNFGRFDSVFVHKILLEVNNKKGFKYYDLKPSYRNNIMLKLDIKLSKQSNNERKPFNKISIIDSYNLLSGNLYDLSRSFNIDVVKDTFPHSFVNENTLNYVGNTPSICYWDNIKDEKYKELYKDNWNLKVECIKYLKKDLISLLKVMDTFNKYVFMKYDIQMTDCLTISRLAMNIFLRHYLKDSRLPIIKSNIYKDIKNAYYGGITEVYKPYADESFYYDVNSLYPYSSLNSIPGKKCTYLEDFSCKGLNLDNLFGFFYCEIEANNSYLGLLPVRHDSGLIMPNGKWSGWYFSEELKFAVDNNYSIKVIKGYNFDKQDNVFNEYVTDLFKIKSNSGGHIKVIAKSLLNNLIGRFGLNINKAISEIVDFQKLKLILSTRKLNSLYRKITDKDYLVSYYPEVSKGICESHNIDYFEAYNNTGNTIDMERDNKFNDVSLTTAAAITSYARIYMSKIKLYCLENNIQIYYMDTDSLVTDKHLPDDLVGNDIGQFKLEYVLKKAYFISAKTYCLLIKKESNKQFGMVKVIKAKGVLKNILLLKDFKDMYNYIDVNTIKRSSVKNLEQGSVVIEDIPLNLNHNTYKKREKIYNNNNLWVDTRPWRIINNNKIRSYHTKRYLHRQDSKQYNLLIFIYIVLSISIYINILFILFIANMYYDLPVNIDINYSNENNICKNNYFINTDTSYSEKTIENNMCINKYSLEYLLDLFKSKISSVFDLFKNKHLDNLNCFRKPYNHTFFQNTVLNFNNTVSDFNNIDYNHNYIKNKICGILIEIYEEELKKKNIIISEYMIKDLNNRINMWNDYYDLISISKDVNDVNITISHYMRDKYL